MTTLVRALEAVQRGDPFALRMSVDAMGDALNILRETDAETTADADSGAMTKSPPTREHAK